VALALICTTSNQFGHFPIPGPPAQTIGCTKSFGSLPPIFAWVNHFYLAFTLHFFLLFCPPGSWSVSTGAFVLYLYACMHMSKHGESNASCCLQLSFYSYIIYSFLFKRLPKSRHCRLDFCQCFPHLLAPSFVWCLCHYGCLWLSSLHALPVVS
jgi:hypothetical protein